MDEEMQKTVCVYVGGCVGSSAIHYAESFDELHIFEPNPEAYAQLVENLKLYQEKIFIQNYACDVDDGFRNFYVTKNVVSSSLGEPTELTNGIEVEKIITVRTINLLSYLKQKKINLIDLLVTDTQGSDLTILSTIKEMIDDSRVLQIMTETHSDVISIYKGMNNKFSGFKNLLEKNYYLDFYLFDMKLKNNTYTISELDEEWDTVWTVKNKSADFKIKLIPLEDQETGVLINLTKAKKRNPNFNLSKYLIYRRRVKNVVKDSRGVSTEELLDLAKFHVGQKDYLEAKKLLTILIDRRPSDFDTRFQLACLLRFQNNDDNIKALRESINELFKILSDFPHVIHKPKEYSEFFVKMAES
jgi:FkbM family methyltransferase